MVFLGVGSRYESNQQQGLAHFTEHMVFKGGEQFKNTSEISRALDSVGGEFNAFTSQEYTAFYTKTAPDYLKLSLDILADMILRARFPEDELAKEKGVIVEEINMYEDMPMRKVDDIFMDLVFGDTPMGRPVVGSKKSVTAFTPADFQAYRKEFYLGAQCTIAIAGALDPDQAKKLVEAAFKSMAKGESYQPAPVKLDKAAKRISSYNKSSEQTHLILAAEAYQRDHPQRYALRLLATMLGGNMSSRLFEKVREEQGLCYYVHASTDVYQDVGFLTASAGVDNKRLAAAVAAIVKQFKEIRDGAITEDELNRAKQYLSGRTILAMEDSENVAHFYASQDQLEGTRETPAEVLAAMQAVSISQIHAVAQEIMHDHRLRLAVIGPKHQEDNLDKLLHLD